MVWNYLKIALRNFRRHRGFSFINIFGLAVGICCFILIAGYVVSQLRYDRYPKDAKNIYRVLVSVTGNGKVAIYPDVDVAVGRGMQTSFPEVKAFTRLVPSSGFVRFGDKEFKESRMAFADSNFFQMFSIPLVKGNPASALTEPNSMVISADFAHRYFGNEDPVGQMLALGNGRSLFKVTGVFEKIPDQSHFHFDAFMSLSTWHLIHETWSNIGIYTYLELQPHTDPVKLEKKFPGLVAQYVVPEVQHDMGISYAEAQKSVHTFVFSLQPLTQIHLYSHTKYELEPNGDIRYVYIFSALAIFILILACINFTNLSTALAAKRSREVGVRKVLGSAKGQLIRQFLSESILYAFFALAGSLVLVFVLLPYFNELAGSRLHLGFFMNTYFLIGILGLTAVVGVMAGLYPAFFLASFQPIQVLKGSHGVSRSGKNLLRRVLVTLQFLVSTGLIISTLIVGRQLHFMQNQKLGYDPDQVLFLQDTELLGLRDTRTAFKNALLEDPRILGASIGTDVPGKTQMDGTEIYPKEKHGDENGAEIHTNIYHVDYDYLHTLGIHMYTGRFFSKDFPTDSFAVVINKAAAEDLGWGRTDPVGKTIVTSGQHEYKVIGVTDDFHYASLKSRVAPLIMMLNHPGAGLILRIKTTEVPALLSSIEQIWKKYNPQAPFSYYFLDTHFARLYDSELRIEKIFSSFSLIAILIASLGLLGLSAYMIEQRTKEIGIRKVLGASVRQILILISREFLFLVGIAFLISIPLVWWAMHVWLQDYAYRIQISWWLFAAGGLITLLVTVLTISVKALRAAGAEPAVSLRTE